MSIEQQLEALTLAVTNLTAVLQSKMMAGATGNATPAKTETKTEAKQEKKQPPKTEGVSSAPPAGTPDTPGTTDAGSGEIDFATQIQGPIVAMGAAGGAKRETAVAILAALGVKRASEIDKADYPKAMKLIADAGRGA